MPVSIVVKHGVENHEEFAQAGGKSRFRIFPASWQLSVRILDEAIGTNGVEHGHVEDAPNAERVRPRCTAAAQTTAVTVKRRQAGQCRNLFALECSQFGQVGEQGSREYRAAPRHGAEQLVTFAPDRGRTGQGGEFVGAGGEPLCEPAAVENWFVA